MVALPKSADAGGKLIPQLRAGPCGWGRWCVRVSPFAMQAQLRAPPVSLAGKRWTFALLGELDAARGPPPAAGPQRDDPEVGAMRDADARAGRLAPSCRTRLDDSGSMTPRSFRAVQDAAARGHEWSTVGGTDGARSGRDQGAILPRSVRDQPIALPRAGCERPTSLPRSPHHRSTIGARSKRA